VRVGSRAAQDRAGGVLVQVVTGVHRVSKLGQEGRQKIGVTAPCSYGAFNITPSKITSVGGHNCGCIDTGDPGRRDSILIDG
jgi:hypothetical protein